jgi:hypothetical protein
MKHYSNKSFIIIPLVMLAIMVLFFVACEKENISDSKVSKEINSTVFPERPNIPPGETNWDRKSKGFNTTASWTTTDLNTLTPNDLVNALIGSGPDAPIVSNISYTGANVAAGTFSGGMEVLGFDGGIILSSGNIASVAGPNINDATTTNNGLLGDPDLDVLIPGYSTNDATVLEFDFECENIQEISFQYVFASEEYNEWVTSAFNDVFGFFVNGVNIALIPGTTTAVAINNVNCGNPYSPPGGSYCEYYNNNDLSDGGGSIDTEMDGFTVVFNATTPVNPGINHIKLAIADAGDHILDSDVFIMGESFICAPPQPDFIKVSIDIKPTSCPNPIKTKKKGVVPIAILGTADFDVAQIDPATVQLAGVFPLRWGEEDVTTPFSDELIDCYSCTTLGPDGFTDLTFKFDNQEFVSALGENLVDGDCLIIELTGNLKDEFGGIMIKGYDIVRIQIK